MATQLPSARYSIQSRLGAGADAAVWLGCDATGRALAFKVVAADATSATESRLRSEFALLAGLDHAGIVRAFDLFRAEKVDAPLPAGSLVLVEEAISGRDAREVFVSLSPDERAKELPRLMRAVSAALAALHSRGWIHGDIKAEHLIYSDRGPVLCDFGLARRAGMGVPAGTPATMAPEVILGSIEPRSDLWSLGVTLYGLSEGRWPFDGADGDLLRAILTRAPHLPRVMDRETWRVIQQMLEKEPSRRPSAARVVEAWAARLCGDFDAAASLSVTHDLREPALIGREETITQLREVFRQLAAGKGQVLWIAGPAGVGKSRVIRDAATAQRLAAAIGEEEPIRWVGSFDEIFSAFSRDRSESLEVLAVRTVDSIGQAGPTVIHLPRQADSALVEAMVEALQNDPTPPPVLLLIESDSPPSGSVLHVEPLGPAQARALVLSMVENASPEIVEKVVAKGGGLPAVLCEIVRESHRQSGGRMDRVVEAPSVEHSRSRRTETLGPSREIAEALAVLRRGSVSMLAAVADVDEGTVRAHLEELRRQGLVVPISPVKFAFSDVALAMEIEDRLPTARQKALHRRALLAAEPEDEVARARHLLIARPGVNSQRAALRAAEICRERGAVEEAHRLIARVRECSDGAICRQAVRQQGELLLFEGRYQDALLLLEEFDDRSPELLRLQARTLARLGRGTEAEKTLGKLGDSDSRAIRARVMLQRGDYAAARTAAAHCDTAELREISLLADLYQGSHAQARRGCEDLLREANPSPAARARAHALMGMTEQMEGDLRASRSSYAKAFELAREAGEIHAAATYAANRGSVEDDLGHYGEALSLLRSSSRDLERLGRTAEWAHALYNYGVLLERLGQVREVKVLVSRATTAGEKMGSRLVVASAAMLEGDLALRQGQVALAREAYERAREAYARQGARREEAWAVLQLAVVARRERSRARACELLAQASDEPSLRDRAAIERARIALDLGLDAEEAERAVAEAGERLGRAGIRSDQWRADLALARLQARRGERERARQTFARARAVWEAIKMDTPEIYRGALSEEEEARLFKQPTEPQPRAHWPAEARLRRLLAINKRLNSELSLPRLLEYIVDTVVDLIGAERGFILLVDEAGEMDIRVARNMDRASLSSAEPPISRSIAERSIREGQPIVTVDAEVDERFESAKSVAALHLRSVLAVPLAVKGKFVGSIYVDHRVRRGAFSDEDVALVMDFCDQAAIAIDNARLHREMRRQKTDLERMARELRQRVDARDVELTAMRDEVVRTRGTLGDRTSYGGLIGRSPLMAQVYRLLDRVVESSLPVVISGESGSGKELVARAIHGEGGRKSGPFVGENCSAIPETLLESVLFGHVRGAFTGAERDRKGLFEIAHEGTLFLDEIGEMSAGMQSKLLRVLQEGEFRRVGGERTIRVNVRLIAASNRDLWKLVREKKFREDLFYRLSVLRVELPPLRERREDIPMLVQHFLRKHLPERQIQMDRKALAQLCAYSWPGNVRELENEVLRAVALAGAADTLTSAELSPHVATGFSEVVDSEDLSLRKRVDALERGLISQALDRSQGNQSRAAALLGISRFGLQKKMRRLGNMVARQRQPR